MLVALLDLSMENDDRPARWFWLILGLIAFVSAIGSHSWGIALVCIPMIFIAWLHTIGRKK